MCIVRQTIYKSNFRHEYEFNLKELSNNVFNCITRSSQFRIIIYFEMDKNREPVIFIGRYQVIENVIKSIDIHTKHFVGNIMFL